MAFHGFLRFQKIPSTSLGRHLAPGNSSDLNWWPQRSKSVPIIHQPHINHIHHINNITAYSSYSLDQYCTVYWLYELASTILHHILTMWTISSVLFMIYDDIFMTSIHRQPVLLSKSHRVFLPSFLGVPKPQDWLFCERVANSRHRRRAKIDQEQRHLINYGCPKNGCKIMQNWWFLRRIPMALGYILKSSVSFGGFGSSNRTVTEHWLCPRFCPTQELLLTSIWAICNEPNGGEHVVDTQLNVPKMSTETFL